MSYDFLDVLCEIEMSEDWSTIFIVNKDEVKDFCKEEAFFWLLDNEDKFKSCRAEGSKLNCTFKDEEFAIDIF